MLSIKKNKIYSLVLLIIPVFAHSQTWHQIADFPGVQRDDAISFVIGDTAYCGTGNMPWGNGTIDFYSLDLNSDLWSSVASLPAGEERQYACGFSNHEFGFVFGGYSAGNFINDVWMYNPIANSWIEKTPLPSVGRSGSSVFVIEDTAYIVGGKTSTNYATNEVWAYNMMTDTWIQKSDFPFGTIWRASATSSANMGYLMFGKDANLSYSNTLFEYNASNDTWAMVSEFPLNGRIYSSLSFFNNTLLVIAGLDSLNNSYNDFWKFDLNTDAWIQLNSIPSSGRRGGISFVSNSAIYYSTGIDATNQRLKETWKNTNPLIIFDYESANVTLYPNPSSDYVYLHFTSNNINYESQEFKLAIYNTLGEIVQQRLYLDATNPIDLSYLEGGRYFLTLKNSDFYYTTTLIKF